MSRSRKFLAGFAAVFVLVAAGLLWLAATEPGLRALVRIVTPLVPGELVIADASGRLLGPMMLRGVDYRDAGTGVAVAGFELDWQPKRLLGGTLLIERLQVGNVAVSLPAATEDSPKAAPLPDLRLPVALELQDVRLAELQVRVADGEPLQVESIALTGQWSGDQVTIDRLLVSLPQAQLEVSGKAGLSAAAATALQLAWQVQPPNSPAWAGEGSVAGNWNRFELQHQLAAPLAASLTAVLEEPLGELRWSGALDIPTTGLQALGPTLPEAQLGAALKASGDLQRINIEGDLQTDYAAEALYTVGVHGKAAQIAEDRWRIEPLAVTREDVQLRLSGETDLAGQALALEIGWEQLGWPFVEPQWQSRRGQLTITGALSDYRLAANLELGGVQLPPGSWSLAGQGSAEHLRVSELDGSVLDGHVTASGELTWRDGLRWTLSLAGDALDPGRHWREWPGRVSGTVRSEGQYSEGAPSFSLVADSLRGTLREYPVQAGLQLRVAQSDWFVDQLELQSGDARIKARGQLTQQWDLDWQAEVPRINELLPRWHGAVSSQGSMSGPRTQPLVAATASMTGLRGPKLRAETATLKVNASLVDSDAPLTAELAASGVNLAGRSIDRLSARSDGTLGNHQVNVEAQGVGHALRIDLRGQWREPLWRGELATADWELPETGRWALTRPINLEAGGDLLKLPQTCWQQAEAGLCVQLSGGVQQGWQGDGELRHWPLARLQPWLPTDAELTASIDARASGQLSAAGLLIGDARISIAPGNVTWSVDDNRETVSHGPGEVSVQVDAGGARLSSKFELVAGDTVLATVVLPGFRPGKDAADQSLRGEVHAQLRDPGLMEALFAEVERLKGEVAAEVQLSGTLAAPAIQGFAELRDAEVSIVPAGIRLTALNLRASGDQQGRVAVTASAQSGPGDLQLKGRLELKPEQPWSGRFAITGNGFEAINLPEARVLASPDLQLALQPGRLDLKGVLTIPEARLEPRDFSGAVSPSRDVVLVDDQSGVEERMAVYTQVQVVLGDKVEFDGFGLKGRFGGELKVVDEPQRVTTARGALRVLDGSYTAYGQDLAIEQGRLLFTGGPVDNPGLDVRAVRKVSDVTAGVSVGGTLLDPEFNLFSTPPLSQADTLSYLLLGRPLARASSAEGQLLFQAASSLGMKGGNLLAETIGSSFGLDEVAVTGGDTLEEAALVIGKYLSPRLYVNYSVGLFDTANQLRMRYEMSRRWSLQTETGTATGADLLFTLER